MKMNIPTNKKGFDIEIEQNIPFLVEEQPKNTKEITQAENLSEGVVLVA